MWDPRSPNVPQVIDAFSRASLDYTAEDIETLKAPERILDEIDAFGTFTGDCDDVSILVATILSGIGVPARFVAIRLATDADFTHVFTEGQFLNARTRQPVWIRFDATVPVDTIHRWAETMVVDV